MYCYECTQLQRKIETKIRKLKDRKELLKAAGDDIRTIKNHVFYYDKHILYDGIGKFDADYNMAVAWKRLSEGNPEERDILLLRHELLESEYEKVYNLSASEAHQKADAVYPWYDKLIEELGEGEEKDGLLQS